eukprot:2454157-Prymnesium_polylepis.1
MPRSVDSLRSNSVLSLDSSSDDESVTHNDVDSMMRPLLKKQKKAMRRLERVERLVQKLINVPETELPVLRKKVEAADATAYEVREAVEGVKHHVVSLASQHSLDAFKKEQRASDEKTRALIEEVSGR